MNVGELIETLRRYPDTHTVVLASDEEGNSFHDVAALSPTVGFFRGPDGSQLTCREPCDTPEQRSGEHDDENYCSWRPATVPAVVLWP